MIYILLSEHHQKTYKVRLLSAALYMMRETKKLPHRQERFFSKISCKKVCVSRPSDFFTFSLFTMNNLGQTLVIAGAIILAAYFLSIRPVTIQDASSHTSV